MKKCVLLFLAVPQFLWASMATDLNITDMVVRANPPARPITAAYMNLTNHSEFPIEIMGVHSDAAEKTQIHDVITENNSTRMEHLKTLEIPALSTVDLTPGGKHIMLINLTEEIHPGSKVNLTFDFKDGSHVTVTAPVEAMN